MKYLFICFICISTTLFSLDKFEEVRNFIDDLHVQRHAILSVIMKSESEGEFDYLCGCNDTLVDIIIQLDQLIKSPS